MKLERAQEIYSAYLGDDLSPAMKLAMEQHFESDPSARKDFDDFARMFDLLQDYATEIEPPSGFRARVMELATIEDAKRRSAGTGFVVRVRDFFLQPRRREATIVLACVVGTAVVAGVFLKPVQQTATPASVASYQPTAGLGSPFTTSTVPSALNGSEPSAPIPVITGVTMRTSADGTVYHDIGVRLPDEIRHATIGAYCITATQQIIDTGARERDATPLLTAGGSLSGGTTINIPVPVPASPQAPAGSTLNVLVDWNTDQSGASGGAQVVFTPMNPADTSTAATPPSSSGTFFNSLQTIASAYHVTVVADATAPPTKSVPAWQPGDSVLTAIGAVVRPAGYDVKPLGTDTYFVYHTTSGQ